MSLEETARARLGARIAAFKLQINVGSQPRSLDIESARTSPQTKVRHHVFRQHSPASRRLSCPGCSSQLYYLRSL
jgi:hypothetical protein